MRRTLFAVLLFSFLISSTISLADVIKTDPNTPDAAIAATEAVSPDDSALQQPVSYEAKQKRLHTVVDELAQMTGVSVRCGKNSNDWQTRDLPVTVFVKDMPLGQLLRLLADCTHLELKAEKIEDKRVYRFLSNPAILEQYADYDKINESNQKARISRCWDVCASLAEYPDTALITPEDEKHKKRLDFAHKMGRIVAHLGPEAKNKMIIGDAVLVSMADPEISQTVGEVLQMLWDSQNGELGFGAGRLRNDVINWSDPSKCCIKFQGYNIDVDVVFGLPYKDGFNSTDKYYCGRTILEPIVQGYASPKCIRGYKSLPEEQQPRLPQIQEKQFDENWVESSNQAPMQAKLDLSSFKEQDFPQFVDVVAEIARVSGWNVVCEDYLSHRVVDSMQKVFAKDITVRQALEGLYNIHWYLKFETRTICGIEWDWREHHKNLVKEELLVKLQEKLEGSGVRFDDAIPLAFITQDQYYDWISYSPKMSALANLDFFPHKGLWQVFASLSREDRELAMSGMGLPLRKVYSPQLRDAVIEGNREVFMRNSDLLCAMERQIPTDPDELADVVVTIKKEDQMFGQTVQIYGGGISRSVGKGGTAERGHQVKTCYSMEISGTRDGKPFSLTIDGPSGFPIYSLQWKRDEKDSKKMVGSTVK